MERVGDRTPSAEGVLRGRRMGCRRFSGPRPVVTGGSTDARLRSPQGACRRYRRPPRPPPTPPAQRPRDIPNCWPSAPRFTAHLPGGATAVITALGADHLRQCPDPIGAAHRNLGCRDPGCGCRLPPDGGQSAPFQAAAGGPGAGHPRRPAGLLSAARRSCPEPAAGSHVPRRPPDDRRTDPRLGSRPGAARRRMLTADPLFGACPGCWPRHRRAPSRR